MADLDEATLAQRSAADPSRSTWLTANAGSGKTRVLTDRVARLLLTGTDPARILCLTYTKAAATEMQNRLLGRLGGWAMLPDARLAAELAALGETGAPDLGAARRLFAQAIETPGGLKVQTIHSFCAAVLRRFPLEAGVPQGFAELDDRSAANLRAEIIEEMARDGDPGFDELLTIHGGDDLDRFLAGLRGFAPPDEAEIWRAAGLAPGRTADDIAEWVFQGDMGRIIAALIPHLANSNKTDMGIANEWRGLNWAAPGVAEWAALENRLLYGKDAKAGPFTAKIGKFPAVALQRGPCAAQMDDLAELMNRVEVARTERLALDHARKTLALQRFGHAFERRYVAAKQAGGWLDFDDLIERTARLLSDSAMAQWVLFRLDGGIDHILVDEAQDTSPGQWQVVARLTDEFTAGQGAHEGARTLFVVGDPKQSIYSFQGADIAVFAGRRDEFRTDFANAGIALQDAALRHSFRSSPAVLSLVDAVFQDEAAKGLEEEPHHVAFHAGAPGEIELWPPVPKPDKPAPADWRDPVDQPAPDAADTVLAEAVAARVAQLVGAPLYDVGKRQWRRARPGDVLILVQRRAALFEEIIAALKRRGLPVAGADRLKLAAELAVKDIRAVLSFLATPEDDLSLAAALRSPLFGLSEDALFRLAAPRQGYLWAALRQSEHHAAVDLLSDLMGQADFQRPHDLISRLLVRHGGRARLIARLGHEAEDGIDELLSQALTYESTETPSLTGFLVWLSDDEIEVRRQPGAAGDGDGLIRVMTVHGSKGLESPIVILPETAKRHAPNEPRTITPPDGPPAIWRGSKDERPAHVEAMVTRQAAAREEERRRLLYVALTRAETRLIVAASGETGDGLDSWYGMVAAGFDRLTGMAETREDAKWGGEIRRLRYGDWGADIPRETRDEDTPPLVLPDWVNGDLPPVPARRRPIAATALGGAKALGGAEGDDAARMAAMLHGTRLHLLLEILPNSDPAGWDSAARGALAGAEGGLPDADELAALLDEAREVITAEALTDVFAPDADEVLREVPFAVTLPGIGPLTGTFDRLHVGEDRVRVIDFKSNATVPSCPEDVPEGILRQMAAYRAAAAQVFPGRAVGAALLWTRTASLMELPEAVLDAALQRASGLDPTDARS